MEPETVVIIAFAIFALLALLVGSIVLFMDYKRFKPKPYKEQILLPMMTGDSLDGGGMGLSSTGPVAVTTGTGTRTTGSPSSPMPDTSSMPPSPPPSPPPSSSSVTVTDTEAERKEAERKEAERKEAERKEAERKEAERKAKEEAERKAKEEAERKEAERKAKEEAEKKAKEEAEKKAKEEAEKKAKEEAGKLKPYSPTNVSEPKEENDQLREKYVKLNPENFKACNGVNLCWINAPLFAIVSHMNIYKYFHDNIDASSCITKQKDEYNNIYQEIIKFHETRNVTQWSNDQYNNMKKLLGKVNNNISSISPGCFGTGGEVFNIFLEAIFKQCFYFDYVYVLNDRQVNKDKPLPARLTKNDEILEIVSIIYPTTTQGGHFNSYVRDKNNNFINFDARNDNQYGTLYDNSISSSTNSGGTRSKQYTFNDIFKGLKGDFYYTGVYINVKYLK